MLNVLAIVSRPQGNEKLICELAIPPERVLLPLLILNEKRGPSYAPVQKAVVLNKLRRGLWHRVAFEIAARPDAYKWGGCHAPHNRVGFTDRPQRVSPGQSDPPPNADEVRKNEVHVENGIKEQQLGDKRKNVKAAESSRGGNPN